MHMADSLLSPAVGAAFWAGTSGVLAYSAKKLNNIPMDVKNDTAHGCARRLHICRTHDELTIPGTGSSGHLGGGMILAVILGPCAGLS